MRAATGILVDFVDQFADCAAAVAGDLRRLAPRRGDQLVVDDEQPVVGAGGVLLDDDFIGTGQCRRETGDDLLARVQVHCDAAALVAVLRLDHYRYADLLSRRPGIFGAGDGAAARHGNADRRQ